MNCSTLGLLANSLSTHAGTESLRVMRNTQTESNFGQTQFLALGPLLIAFSLIFAASVPTANAQNPSQYQLTWLGDGRPRDINEAGLVAFGWSSYIYNHVTGAKVDLNDPQYNASWLDLEDQANETGQWQSASPFLF